MKKVLFLLLITLFILGGCSNDNPKQLSSDEIDGLGFEEQIESIVDNTNLVEDYQIVVEGNSVAIVYPTEKVPDSKIVLDKSKESFPNVAMILVEHLSVLDIDELVITSYEPSDTDITGLTRVSALFKEETIKDLDFDEWREDKSDYQQKFYRNTDAYLIRDNLWEKQDDEIKDKINGSSKSDDSQFWDYYGSYVE